MYKTLIATIRLIYDLITLLLASSFASALALLLLSFLYKPFGPNSCHGFVACCLHLAKNAIPDGFAASIVASPALLIYFPLSLKYWYYSRSKWWKLVAIGSILAAVNGFVFFLIMFRNSSFSQKEFLSLLEVSLLFGTTGFITAIFQYTLLYCTEKMWEIRKFGSFIKLK